MGVTHFFWLIKKRGLSTGTGREVRWEVLSTLATLEGCRSGTLLGKFFGQHYGKSLKPGGSG